MATKSTLSTESPPFNPNRILSRGRQSPNPAFRGTPKTNPYDNRSRSSSPYPPASATPHAHSNAVPKYTFQDPVTG